MRYRHGDRESPAQPGKPQKEKVGGAFADVHHGSVSEWSSTLSTVRLHQDQDHGAEGRRRSW